MSSSLWKWVEDLPWMMQGVLFSAIRGCDGVLKEDVTKIIARGLRAIIIRSAKASGSFLAMTPTTEQLKEAMNQLCGNKGFDHYPIHYILHLIHAAEIIGYKYPDMEQKLLWYNFYIMMCHAFHMYPESESDLDKRLKDDPVVVERNLKIAI